MGQVLVNMGTRALRWNVTINSGYTEATLIELLDRDDIVRFVGQEEEVNHRHYQCYVEFAARKTLQQVRTIFFGTAHVEVARGSPWQNYKYCTKDESSLGMRLQKGEFTEPRAAMRERTKEDPGELLTDVKNGMSDLDLMDKYPGLFLRSMKQITDIRRRLEDHTTCREIGCVLLTGITGCGKSHAARQYATTHHGGDYFALVVGGKNNTTWWDGYMGQKLLIIDDFDGGLNYRKLLQILDHYPLQLEVKGSFTTAAWTEVIITSNTTPQDWYRNEDVAPLLRRIGTTVSIWETSLRMSTSWDWTVPIAKVSAPVFERP